MKPSNMRIFSFIITLIFSLSMLLSLGNALKQPFWEMVGEIIDKILMVGVGVFFMINSRKNGPYEKAWEKKQSKKLENRNDNTI